MHQRMADGAQHLAAVRLHHAGGVPFKRLPEGVVGNDEEPGVAAGLHDCLAGAVGQCPGVVGPVHRVRRAGLAREVGCPGAGIQEDLVLRADDVVDGEGYPELGTSTMMSTLSTSSHWRAMLDPTSGLF